MDSITQAALGAAVAGAVAERRCNGRVLIAGAILGTLPDLDVFIDYGNDVRNMISHRGLSHSLLVLPSFSLVLAWLVNRFRPLSGWSFARLWALIAATLISHPLLDFFTSYGTQLLWPLGGYYSLSSIFIIDPLYTTPLLIAILYRPVRRGKATKVLCLALVVSSAYLGWSLVAKQLVANRVQGNLPHPGITHKQILISPTPFNTLLWRIVIVDEESYWEGLASLLDAEQGISFERRARGDWPLEQYPPILNSFLAFTHDFVRYQIDDKKLVVTDLRLGMFENLPFRFVFAEQGTDGQWLIKEPVRLAASIGDIDLWSFIKRIFGYQAIDDSSRRKNSVDSGNTKASVIPKHS
ncbi:MAG: hydrolase [Deltaproteobacteria bacterium]|nr:MAG: hydrolase [Deltaproteobacteria bacterium]